MTESSGDTNRTAMTRGMKVTIALVAVVVAAALVAIMLVWSPWASDGSTSGQPGSPGATASAGTDAGASGSSGAKPTGPGPSPSATPQKGSEVLPPSATPGSGVPPLKKPEPLMKAPLPASGAKSDGLVKGFPRRVLGPMKGSTVISTSIATDGSHSQITLIAVTAKSEEDLAAHYGAVWADLGLQPSETSDGTLQYTGPYESVTLSTQPSGTGNRYTIFGSFRTE